MIRSRSSPRSSSPPHSGSRISGSTTARYNDLFVLHQLGYDDLTLYDESMGKRAKDLALPIETD